MHIPEELRSVAALFKSVPSLKGVEVSRPADAAALVQAVHEVAWTFYLKGVRDGQAHAQTHTTKG